MEKMGLFQTATSVPGPGDIVTNIHTKSLRTDSEFAIALWVLWNQASLACKARCLGAHLSDGSLKSWASDVMFKPFLSQRDTESCGFPVHYV